MKRISTLAYIAFILVGCASPRIAVLQNPQTKQTVECRANPMGSFTQAQVENCIAAYKKAGYVLVADSADNQPTAK